jgi:hypothetical protein
MSPGRRRCGPCAAAGALLAAVLLAGCGSAARTSTPARASAVAPVAAGRASCPGQVRLAVAARQAVGAGAGPLALEGGAVWVARPQAGEVIRVGAAGSLVAHLGGTPISLALGFGKLWVAERDGNRVVSLNEQTLEQRSAASIPVPVSVVAGSLGVWALSIDTNSLYRLDPASGISAPPYDSPVASPVEMVAVADELWVLGAEEEGLSPFNTELERIVRAGFDLPARALSGLSAAGGTIWLGETAGRSLLRVDAATAAVQRLPAPDGIQVIATAAGACGLWVADGSGDVALVDPQTAALLGPPIHIGRSVADLAVSSTGVWVSDPLDGTLVHVEVRSAAG